MQWWYWNKVENNQCKVDHFVIHQFTDYFFPEWGNPTVNPQESDLALRWENYMKSVKIHESGHRQHGLDAANEATALMNTFPGYSSCGELDTALKTQVNGIFNSLSQRGRDYDAQTGHGETQLIVPHILYQ